jgi:hypothetical protein
MHHSASHPNGRLWTSAFRRDYASTRQKVQAALEALGIEFMNGGEPGVRLTRQGRRRDSETATRESRPAAAPKAARQGKARQRASVGRREGVSWNSHLESRQICERNLLDLVTIHLVVDNGRGPGSVT